MIGSNLREKRERRIEEKVYYYTNHIRIYSNTIVIHSIYNIIRITLPPLRSEVIIDIQSCK